MSRDLSTEILAQGLNTRSCFCLGAFSMGFGGFWGLGSEDAFSRIGEGSASLSDTHPDTPVDRPRIPDLRDKRALPSLVSVDF
jgi:hypothetical protein